MSKFNPNKTLADFNFDMQQVIEHKKSCDYAQIADMFDVVPHHEKHDNQAQNSKQLTDEQIQTIAKKHGIDVPSLKAVIKIECGNGKGFLKNGKPKILYEAHIAYKRLGLIKWFTRRKLWSVTHRSLFGKKWKKWRYNSHGGDQHLRLQIASTMLDSQALRNVCLESCSWGLGQVMGYHWQDLGYDSIDDFVAKMYESEYEQLEAMIRFLKKNHLIDYLNNQNWSAFAYRYNGEGYEQNHYDTRLQEAYSSYIA